MQSKKPVENPFVFENSSKVKMFKNDENTDLNQKCQ